MNTETEIKPPGSSRSLPPGLHNAMAHFYRGEMNRLTVWRVRLDTTTNGSILSMAAGGNTIASGGEAGLCPSRRAAV